MTQVTTAMQIRPVRDRDELTAALHLVHENYVRIGYMRPQDDGIRIGVHNALPTTRTFSAFVSSEIAATATLFEDSFLGLPLDAVFRREADELRAAGRRISEVGMLADRREDLRRGLDLLLQMMRVIFWEIRRREIDDLLITVHRKHARFYTKFLGLEPVGEQRAYEAVNGVPAQLLRLRVEAAEGNDFRHDQVRNLFLEGQDQPGSGEGHTMSAEDFRHFYGSRAELFASLTDAQRQMLDDQFAGRTHDLLFASCGEQEGHP